MFVIGSMQVSQEFLLDISLLLKADLTILAHVVEDPLHLATVILTEVLPQLDQRWAEFGLNVIAGELLAWGRSLRRRLLGCAQLGVIFDGLRLVLGLRTVSHNLRTVFILLDFTLSV